jgi:hypothetical protein
LQQTTNISSTFSEYPTGGYRFRFNGQEKDQKIYNNQSTTTALFWEYDSVKDAVDKSKQAFEENKQ